MKRPKAKHELHIADVYAATVLAVNFDDAKRLFHRSLIEIHFAHTLMLSRQNILTGAEAVICLAALKQLQQKDLSNAVFGGGADDYFFFIEQCLEEIADPDVVSKIHTARSRNDIDLTLYRMKIREELLFVIEYVHDLRSTLVGLASEHVGTLIPAYTHGQPAQPTTLAHYLMATAECLGRDEQRLRAAFETVNKSPMGACAITTTAFPIDRDYIAGLLGFDGIQLNSYGAIATVDYMAEATSAVSVAMLGLGRFIQDLLVMCRREVGTLRLNDGFVQTSSIMPQKRNPSALEHCRVLASKSLGEAQAILTALHNTPFADMVDGEDDLQPLVFEMFSAAQRTTRLLAAILNNSVFNTERLREQAYDNFLTVTELADTLVREAALSFRDAHLIVFRAVEASPDANDFSGIVERVRQQAIDLLGRDIDIPRDRLLKALDAQNFVEIRCHPGGPAESSTIAHIVASEKEMSSDQRWIVSKKSRLAQYPKQLQRLAEELIANGVGH